MGLPGLPDQIDAVGDFRHEGFGETESPVAVFVVGGESHGVAARVGGVVPGAVVVGGPVEELEVRIGAHRIDVEEVGHAELAEAEFETAARQFVEEREPGALVLDFIFAEREDLMDHAPAEIGCLAQERVAHDIQIGVAGEAEALSESGATCFFNVHQQFGGVVQAHTGVERHYAGSGFLVVRAKAVRAAVERRKIGMGLKNEVGLTGEPEARVLEMREHGLGAVVGRRVRGIVDRERRLRRRSGSSLGTERGLARLLRFGG